MTYDELVTEVARQAGALPEEVRQVFQRLPEVLMRLQVHEKVRTPLGTFVKKAGAKRLIKLPDQDQMAEVPAREVVKLRPGNKLRVES
jgi:nucleoid DNA-binding protein